MKIIESAAALYWGIDEKFCSQFGFYITDVSWANITDYMHRPQDSSSLAVTRILFGLLMLFDIAEERGGSTMDKRWGNPQTCHFPLFSYLKPLPMPYMASVYAALWTGALGIMLGFKYRTAASMFTVCYWYLFLIEKSYWNNHSYLFGLVAMLLTCTDANCYMSIDAYLNPTKLKTTVPYWNYFILKFQFFIMYFVAGLKKGTAEWLTGYSVPNLSEHWVFTPFKLFLNESEIDYLVVHWFVFVFDLTVAFWMMYSKTRNVAVFFCVMFHLINIRLFSIGMFPWVCLATLPLFYPFDWPKVLFNFSWQTFKPEVSQKDEVLAKPKPRSNLINYDKKVESYLDKIVKEDRMRVQAEKNKRIETETREGDNDVSNQEENYCFSYYEEKFKTLDEDRYKEFKRSLTLFYIMFHVSIQAFLPYSHFITKGYNTWTGGLYGYSWDMMVHTWDTSVAYVSVEDRNSNQTYLVDSTVLTPNDRWSRHGDMVYQYSRCLKEYVHQKNKESPLLSKNFSIFIDVWCSMNGRFTQRLFDKQADMLQVEWSPFKTMSYVMPLLDEALSWRETIYNIKKNVFSWNNNSDVLFLAEFPGYDQDKFVGLEVMNVTISVLKGVVAYGVLEDPKGFSRKLSQGDTINVDLGVIHNIWNIGYTPAYYMYTFSKLPKPKTPSEDLQPKLPIMTEISNRFKNMSKFGRLMTKGIVETIFDLSQYFLAFSIG